MSFCHVFLVSLCCGGQRSSQFSCSWNQWEIIASRVPFKSQFELVLSCSVLKELVVISSEPSSFTCADAFIGSWTALFFLDGNSDKRPMNAIFRSPSCFQDQNQLVSGQHYFLQKLFSSPLNSCSWRSQLGDLILSLVCWGGGFSETSPLCNVSGRRVHRPPRRSSTTRARFILLSI